MGLRIRHTSSSKARLAIPLFAVVALMMQPAAGLLQGVKADALDGGPDLSKIYFADAKYVRENNAGDLAAQLKTDNAPTDVKFYVDGKDNAPIGGTRKSSSEWRLYTALDAGKHLLSAEVKIDGEWYDVPKEGVVYSLDAPDASYSFPNHDTMLFRPGDNPLRLKIDDEFGQFKDAKFDLYRYDLASATFGDFIGSFTVGRDQCDDRQAGKYLLCDIGRADNWSELAEGSYAVKLTTHTQANNGIRPYMEEYWSHSFMIDSVQPVVTDFKIESSTTVGSSLKVAATAADNNQVEGVNFYVTRPREDGACTGNGTALTSNRVYYADADGYYRTTLDVSDGSITTGTYCVMAVARDGAMSNSEITKLAFVVDHTSPAVTLHLISASTMMASSGPITLAGSVGETLAVLKLTNLRTGDEADLKGRTDANGNWTYALPSEAIVAGEYNFSLYAEDQHGNYSTVGVGPVTVTPFVPAQGSGVPTNLTQPLVDAFIVPRRLPTAGVTAPFTADKTADADTPQVLGTETAKNPGGSNDAAITTSEDGWRFFGIAWYWWTLIGGGTGAAAWRVVASLRQRSMHDMI